MLIPGVFVFLMWLVKIIEILFDLDLSNFGIYPLSLEGLPGVIFSPFIHANFRTSVQQFSSALLSGNRPLLLLL